MKLKTNIEGQRTILTRNFGDLNSLDVFDYNNDIYIAIYDQKGATMKALNLSSGAIVIFGNETKVMPVATANLTITLQ